MGLISKREAKIDLIYQINQTLVTRGKPSISPKDFDILYEMSIKELVSVKKELIRELDFVS
jgi:hypothetical protein